MKNSDSPDLLTFGARINQLLAQYGVDVIFGIPGAHNIELFRGLEDLGIGLVLPRHEQGIGFMADGYARATRKPGICFVTTGPGVTNIMTSMGQAYSDSVPLLVISSILPRTYDQKGKGSLHGMRNQRAAASTVSSRSVIADSGADIARYIGQALSSFKACRPRPVSIHIPLDLLDSPGEKLPTWELPEKPYPSPLAIKQAVKILEKAVRPVIIVGGGGGQCSQEIDDLADKIGAAVFTTIAGKGILDNDHPRNLGYVLPSKAAHDFLSTADTVLVVGSQMALKDFQSDSLPITGDIVMVDIDPDIFTRNLPVKLPLLSDAKPAVKALNESLASDLAGFTVDEIDSMRKSIKEESIERFGSSFTICNPIMSELRKILPEDAIVATDMTEPVYFGSEFFPMKNPHCWLNPTGFGTLGYAVPAAIGAKIGQPNRPVVALVGDYGIQFTLSEIMVAVERKLSLPIIIWDNEKFWAIEKILEERGFPVRYSKCKNPDFQQMAIAFGAHSEVPKKLSQFKEIMDKALNRNSPTLIVIRPNNII